MQSVGDWYHRQSNSAVKVKNDVGTMYYLYCVQTCTSYRRSCRRNFKKSSFNSKSKGLVPFLIVESDWRETSLEIKYLRMTTPHNSQCIGCNLCPWGI